MPEPEALVLMTVSLGLLLAGLGAFAFTKKTAVAPTCGCLLCLVAVPGLLMVLMWSRYWATQPGKTEIRASLPGEWVGEGRWATDRLVIARDLTVMQTIAEPDGTKTEFRGKADWWTSDLALITGIDVPYDAWILDANASPERSLTGSEGPAFRFARGAEAPVLIMQGWGTGSDTTYVLKKVVAPLPAFGPSAPPAPPGNP